MKKIKIIIGSLIIAILMTGCTSKKNQNNVTIVGSSNATNDRNGSRRIPTSL